MCAITATENERDGKEGRMKAYENLVRKRVRVKSCEAHSHGENPGCICHLVGRVLRVTNDFGDDLIRRSHCIILRSSCSSWL